MAASRQDVVDLVALALEQASIPNVDEVIESLQKGIEDAPLEEFSDTLAQRSELFLTRVEQAAEAEGSPPSSPPPPTLATVEELLDSLYRPPQPRPRVAK